MSEREPPQPPGPGPKRNTAYDHGGEAPKEGTSPATRGPKSREDGKPDEGTRPDRLTTESDDGQG